MKEKITLMQVLFLWGLTFVLPLALPFAIISTIYFYKGKPL